VLLFLRLVVLLALEVGKILISLSLSFPPVCAVPSTQQVTQCGSLVVWTGESYWKQRNLKYYPTLVWQNIKLLSFWEGRPNTRWLERTVLLFFMWRWKSRMAFLFFHCLSSSR